MTHGSKVDPVRETQVSYPRRSQESWFWLRGKASHGKAVLQWSRFPGWSLLLSVFYLVQRFHAQVHPKDMKFVAVCVVWLGLYSGR